MLIPAAAQAAELKFTPYANAQYLNSSNVLRISDEVAEALEVEDTGDTYTRYAAGFDTTYEWSQQFFSATGEVRQNEYSEFEELDGDDSLVQVGFAGSAFGFLTPAFTLAEERRAAALEDRRTVSRVEERERLMRAGLTVSVTPSWRILTGTRYRNLMSPIPAAPGRVAQPDLTLRETSYSAGLEYGIDDGEGPEDQAPLLVGLSLEHQTVRFSGVVPEDEAATPGLLPGALAPLLPGGIGGADGTTRRTRLNDYELLIAEATLQYAVSGLSTLNAKLGVTQQQNSGAQDSSPLELTGEIRYAYELSAVTKVNARLLRRVAPFAATVDDAVETGAGVGLEWQPLEKLTILADYTLLESDFGALEGGEQDGAQREDRIQEASLSLEYALFRYFSVRVFGTHSVRRSNSEVDAFSEDVVGAEIGFRWE